MIVELRHTMACPDDNLLVAFLDGALAPGQRRDLRDHLVTCARCAALAHSTDRLFAARLAHENGDEDLTGHRFGRYQVVRWLGAGGMSVVYEAQDPELDRRVALKVLRRDLADAPGVQNRLVREAQALARLSAPNVVAIHDVGSADGRVFLTMELIDGQTLAAWLAEQPRALDEILDVLVQAGRGLAAAHAAGLVHRDVKPANILVGRDGRTRVSDFGLVAAAGAMPQARGLAPPEAAAATTRDRASATGLVGTPAYMAPEQRAGDELDARADQFAFCRVALEALHAPPARLRATLTRGLAVAPAARHADMTALLAAIEAATHPGRAARWAAPVVAILGIALAGAALSWRDGGTAPADDATLAGTWDPAQARAVTAAFAASGSPLAADGARRVVRGLDDYASTWRALIGASPPADTTLAERRRRCLHARRAELAALTNLLVVADRPTVERAVTAVRGLEAPTACLDDAATALLFAGAGAVDDSPAASVVRAVLALSRAHRALGGYRAARALADRAVGLAGAADSALHAEALVAAGEAAWLLDEPAAAERDLSQARQVADAANAPLLAARALVGLVQVVGVDGGRTDDGLAIAEQARARLRGLRGVTQLDAQLASAIGSIELRRGRAGAAASAFERELELEERSLGADHPELASALADRARARFTLGDLAGAAADNARALTLLEAAYGETHPRIAAALGNQAAYDAALGRTAQAITASRRALAIKTAAYGPDHVSLAPTLNGLGNLLAGEDLLLPAEAVYRRALAISAASFGPEHVKVAPPLINLAFVLLRQGRIDEALALTRRARAILSASQGARHPEVIALDCNEATLLATRGQVDDAIALRRAALTSLERLGQDADQLVAGCLADATAELLARHDHAAAMAIATRSLAAQTRLFGATSVEVANAELQLARVALARRRGREALTRAEAASTLLTRLGRSAPLATAEALLVMCAAHGELGEGAAAVQACASATSVRLIVPGLDPALLRESAQALARARHAWPDR